MATTNVPWRYQRRLHRQWCRLSPRPPSALQRRTGPGGGAREARLLGRRGILFSGMRAARRLHLLAPLCSGGHGGPGGAFLFDLDGGFTPSAGRRRWVVGCGCDVELWRPSGKSATNGVFAGEWNDSVPFTVPRCGEINGKIELQSILASGSVCWCGQP
jgi:hypothetical protein